MSLCGKRILFFVPHENATTGGVFASQVLGLAQYCTKLGAKSLIFHAAEGESREIVVRDDGVSLLSMGERKVKTTVFNVVKYVQEIVHRYWRELAEFKPTHIYTRNYAMSVGVSELVKATGARLVYSMRGPDVYERTRSGKIRDYIAGFFIGRMVRQAVKKCDVFTSMTQVAVNWIETKYGKKGVAFPCCVRNLFFEIKRNDYRTLMRNRLGFHDTDKVIAWCGNVAAWQCLRDVVLLVKKMTECDSNIRVLFLSDPVNPIEDLCDRLEFSQEYWRAFRVLPDEVPAYLCACDVGLDVLAVDDFKSSICCPIKVGEYLAVGLPVLITRTMGDMPELVKRFEVGKLLRDDLDPHDTLTKLNDLLGRDVEVIRSAARTFFSWEANDENVKAVFN